MRIAGIDPGTICAGVSILEADKRSEMLLYAGTIRSNQRKPISDRLNHIFSELKTLFDLWRPEVVAIENVFYQKDFKAAIKVGEARAAAMIAASQAGVSIVEYPPARIKQSVCGNGRATKEQIQYMVRHMMKLTEPISSDASDAIATALCHIHMLRTSRTEKKAVHAV
jgi:crossover junction endodeoxyribonuclease RuvC